MSRRSSKRAEKLEISYDLDQPSEDLVDVYSTMFAPPSAATILPFPAAPPLTENNGEIKSGSTVNAESAPTVCPEPPPTVDSNRISTVDAGPERMVDGEPPSTVYTAPAASRLIVEPQPRRKTGGLARAGDTLSNVEFLALAERGPAPTVDADTASMGDAVLEPTAQPAPTGNDDSASTVQLGAAPPRPLGGFWITEGNEGVFPASRIRPIVRAQDALTHPEESVYDLLWGPKNHLKDTVRYTTAGYEKIAHGARIAKENAKKIIARLIYKGFIRIETPPDYLHRIATKYAVFSYRAALDNMLRADRRYVVRTGNGVLFAHAMRSISTVDAGIESTVDAQQTFMVSAGQQPTVNIASTETVDTGEGSTVNAASTCLDSKSLQASPSNVGAPAVIARTVLAEMGFVDDDALKTLAVKCRENAPDASDNEIAELSGMTARRIARMRDIDNKIGLLITQTAKCFVGEPFQMYRREKSERERRFAELCGYDGAGKEP